MEFSQQEIIDLILSFKLYGNYHEDAIKDEPEILKFKEFGGYEVDEEGIRRLTQEGELFLHKYIEDMTKELWNLMKQHQENCPFEIAKKIFCGKYCSNESNIEDLLEYLIFNAETYSFEASYGYTTKKGRTIIMHQKK